MSSASSPSSNYPDSPIARAARQAVDVRSGAIHLPAPSRTRVIGVANQKGGVGKTTSTVNLSVALALGGLRVLTIDLDPQGNCSTALGIPHTSGTPSIYEVLIDGLDAREAGQVCPDAPNLTCIPATIDLAGAEIELVSVEHREHRLQRAIAEFGSRFDYVFIDCPPSLGLLTINAMVAAQEMLIPIQCEYYALEGLGQLINNIGLIRKALNPGLDVSTVMLTMFDGRTKLSDQVAGEVKKYFGEKVLKTMIPRSVKVSEAPGFGKSVMTYDPGSRGTMSYLDAAREIATAGVSPMNRPKGGLGRGLAALIPTGPSTSTVSDVFLSGPPATTDEPRTSIRPLEGHVSRETWTRGSHEPDAGPRYVDVPIDLISPNHRNPRGVFDEDALAELTHSIKEFGLLQPVVVRPVGDSYELVMGERRWRAAQQAGLTAIPAIVRRTEDADMLRDALLENIHRANLNPLEEAAAYQQLLAEFDVTHDELASRIGRSRPVVSNTIRLLKLPVAVQRRVASGVLSAGHARALLSLSEAEQQEDLATRIVAEGLSVRGAEEAVTVLAGAKKRRSRTPTTAKTRAVDLDRLAGRLSDLLDTSVRIEQGRMKGKLTIEFASVDDLERMMGALGPETNHRIGSWRRRD